jgi:hypothetical protein
MTISSHKSAGVYAFEICPKAIDLAGFQIHLLMPLSWAVGVPPKELNIKDFLISPTI